MYRIGIDIGGMSAKFGLVEKDRVLEERVLETGADISYGKFLDDASDVVAALCENRKVEAVGISSCGLINSGQGKIVYSNNIGWEDKRIAADLLERTALLFDIPGQAMGLPRVEVVGRSELRMENHRGILAYGPEEIHISGGNLLVVVRGSGLELRAMTPEELLITGTIAAVEFMG